MSLPAKAYASRVTLDIDDYQRTPALRLQKAYYELQSMGAEDVIVAVSSGGSGFHLEAGFMDPIDAETEDKLRAMYGDDTNRRCKDRHRTLCTRTLFHSKEEKGERQVFQTPEDAIDHVAATSRTDYERAKELVNNGRKALDNDLIRHSQA